MLTILAQLNQSQITALRGFCAANELLSTGSSSGLLEQLWQFYRRQAMTVTESHGQWVVTEGAVAELHIAVDVSGSAIRVDRYGIIAVGRKRQLTRVATATQAVFIRRPEAVGV